MQIQGLSSPPYFEKFCYIFIRSTIHPYFSALDYYLKYALLKLTYS